MKRFLHRKIFLIVILFGAATQFANAQSLNYGYAHDLSNGATFDGSPFGLSATAPSDIEFSKDGLDMFILDGTNDEIDIYRLTIPFETSTGVSVNGSSFSVATEEFNPNGIAFSDSGHRMYLTGAGADNVTAYSLTNPFDLSTGVSVDGTPFSLTSQFSNGRDVFVSTDGSKMFALEQDQIYQYSLSIPYRVLSGVTYDNVVFSIASQDTQGFNLSFNDDGTKMFVTGGTGLDINQYSLTTPFDLSSGVSLEGSPFVVSGQETQPRSVDFSADGRTMFVVGWSGDDVNQYSLNADENFAETGSNDGTISGSVNIDITGDTFTHTGSTLVFNTDYSITNLPAGFTPVVTVAGNGLSAVLTLSGKADNHNRADNIENLEFNFENSAFASNDASSVLNATSYESYFGIDYDDNSALLTYGTNFDLSHTPTVDGNFSISSQESAPTNIAFSSDGTKMFVVGAVSDAVHQYTLTTPFDITSGVSYDAVSYSIDSPQDVEFNDDGTKMFVLRDGSTGFQLVVQHTLTNPFDLTSGVTEDDLGFSFSVFGKDSNPRGISFSDDGHTLFFVGLGQNVFQYALTNAFDLTHGTYTANPTSFSTSSEETAPFDIAFNTGGTKMFVIGRGSDNINEYNLSNPFDITSGVVFSGNTMNVDDEDVLSGGMAFDAGGSKVFMIGNTSDRVYQYNLNVDDDFVETSANNGAIESVSLAATITIFGDTFTNAGGNLSSGSHYSISNLPAGLTPTMSVAANALSVTLSLSGTVANHQTSHSVESLIISFENGAFTGGNASAISNTTNASSGFAIDFSDNPVLTYGYDAFDFDAGPMFDGNPFSVLAQEASPQGITFNNDGSKMYIIGTSTNRVHQYSLTTFFDVTSGAAYDGFYVVPSNASDLVFNSSGSKLFVLTGSFVREFSVSIAFDVTSTVALINSLNVGSEEIFPSGLTFNIDGTKMYIVGYNDDDVDQYTLNSAFSLTSVMLDGTSPLIQDPSGVQFSNDGGTMFVSSVTFDNVARYNLTIPFDVTSGIASAGNSFSVAAQESNPTGFTFSTDGSKMFVLGNTGDDVNQYSIDLGGFNEAAANDGTVEGGLTVRIDGDTFTNGGSTLTSPTDFVITNLPAGLTPVLNVAANGLSGEVQITGTAGTQNIDDISSLIFTFENSAFTTNPASAVVNGTSAESGFGIDFIDGPELTYTSLNFDLSAGATFDGNPFGFGTEETTPTDITFNDNGLKMYVVGVISDKVHQYSLTTPFDVTSGVSLETSFSVATQEINPTGVEFNANGSKMYVLGATGDDVNQYSVSSNFDLNSTVVFEGNFSVSSQESTPQGFVFSADGKKMFVTGSSSDEVHQYSLKNSFDINGPVSFQGSFSVASEDGFPADIAFSPDGLKMYISGVIGDDVNIYNLQTAFTITSGVSFQSSFSIVSEETSATGFAFSPDGSKMFIAGQVGDDVNQYSVNVVGFTEAAANDGSANGTILISIAEDTFTSQGGALTETTDYTITNLAAGLVPTMSVSADGLSASLTLSGNAPNNFDTDDILGLQFTFENSAFTNSNAADVGNAINADSGFGIDFFGTPSAPTNIALSNSSIDENEASGTVVGTFTTTDADTGETYTYTLVAGAGGDDNASFTIDDNQLKSAHLYDFEDKPTYSVRVNSNDGNGGNFAKSFTITINDLVEVVTWNGTVWSNGTGPTSSDDVVIDGDYSIDTDGTFDVANITINSGSTFTVDGENVLSVQADLTNNGNMIVESGSSLITYDANTVSGNDIVFKRNTRYADGKYSFVGSPVQQNINTIGSDLGTFVFSYDETIPYGANDGLNRWMSASSDQLVPGTGYTQANQKEVVFEGLPNTGTIIHSGTYTEDTNDDNEGWNLVSNPYSAAIDVADFLSANTNTNGAVYIWDDNGSNSQRGTNADYIIANGSMATNTTPAGGQTRYNQALGLAQGFFVKLNNAVSTDITFNEDMRLGHSNSDDNFFRKAELPIVRINLTNDAGLFKQAVVGFADDATEHQMNRKYDAAAFNSNTENGLFTMKSNQTLALNGMPLNWEEIALQVNVGEAGVYQISVELDQFNETSIYLRDNQEDVTIDLSQGGYTFSSNFEAVTDRFQLLASPKEVLGFEEEQELVYAYNNILYIKKPNQVEKEYRIFNMQGKSILSTKIKDSTSIHLNSIPAGVYLVFDGIKSHKIILK